MFYQLALTVLFVSTAQAQMPAMAMPSPGLESNPLTSCELYPSSEASRQLSTQIQQLQMLASSDPACSQMASMAQSFQASTTMFSGGLGGPAPVDVTPEVVSAINQLTTSFNSFMDASYEGNPCARTQLGQQVRQTVSSTAVDIASKLSAASPFAPVIGGLVGSIAQHIFRALQGPNLVAINSKAITDEEKAKKYGCLFLNFNRMFMRTCAPSFEVVSIGGGTTTGRIPSCYQGPMSAGVLEAQQFASMILGISSQTPGGVQKALSDSNRKTLQGLQSSLRNTKVASPDGKGTKSIQAWLRDAGEHFALNGKDGYPRNASLARGLRQFLLELDAQDVLLRDAQADETALQESVGKIQSALQSVHENAPNAAGELARETGVLRVDPQFKLGPFVGTPVGAPIISDQGLSLTLMAYFKEVMPADYTKFRQIYDFNILAGGKIMNNISLAMATQGSDIVPMRDKHQSFNAIMAITQEPIIKHMHSLKRDTQAGQGRTAQSNCEAHVQLANNCAKLSGVFFQTVGNSARNEYGANIFSDKRMGDYDALCGLYVNKGVITSPLQNDLLAKSNCVKDSEDGKKLSLTKDNATDCALAFQQIQCQGPAQGIDRDKLLEDICGMKKYSTAP